MLKKAAIVAGAAAGMLALAPMANADSADNDGIGVLNETNLSVAPIQACGNDVNVIGATIPIGSDEEVDCTNAPLVDHPSAES